jgi:hypothetical protein
LLLAATASLRLFGAFTRRFEAEFRPVFVATGLVPFAVGLWVTSARASSRNLRRHVLASVGAAVAIVLGGAVLVWSSFFPSYWVLGFDPPARIELVAQFFIVCAVAALGYVAGQLLSAVPLEGMANAGVRAVVTLAGVLVLLGPLNVAVAAAGQLPNAARFAAMWDRNDALLRQAHEAGSSQTVVVPELPQWWGWDWVGPRTGDFPNACVARYYGVAAVRSESVSAAPP